MYTKEYRSDFAAEWICASDEYLKHFDRKKTEEFPDAKFIWGLRYTRTYFRRIFSVKDGLSSAFLRILCDNVTDIFLNGKQIVTKQKDTGRVDISPYLKNGDNLLMIRAYQTASPISFTSALTGGIHIEYSNNSFDNILTDGQFENIRFIGFWENDEPDGWENDCTVNFEKVNLTVVTDMHPIAIKRSCIFRKDFAVSGKVKCATLCGSALGCYEPHINGKKADDVFFIPSAFDKVKEYQRFDVTDMLNDGKNTVAAMLGNGWYNCSSWGSVSARKPALIMELTVEYEDGRREVIATDESWLVCASPLTDNDLQFGERYDASLEVAGWNTPECNCEEFANASLLEKVPYRELLLQNYPPIRTVNRLPVKFICQLPNGGYLYDCGINIAGAVEITLRDMKPSQMITVSVSERLDEQGGLEIGAFTAPYFPKDSLPDGCAPYNLRNINVYFAKGEKTEHYAPRFCYTGFRYICVKGTETAPNAADIIAREMHNDLKITGGFCSEDETLNRFFDAVKQTWFNNCYNGPTDCPTREKNFWTGDTMIFSHLACFFTDCSDFLARWTDLGRKMTGPYGWDDEEYMLPWTLYKFYGDPTVLKEKYTRICKFVDERIATAEGKLLPENPYSCYNDWLNPTGENLTPTFFSHCWYLRMLDITSRIAAVVGDTERENNLRGLYNDALEMFNEMHYDKEKGEYREHIQSSCILPLAFGLVPKGEEQRVADALHRRLEETGFKLTTGFQSSRHILNVLSDYGYGEDAVKLLHQTEFPSWGHMFATGATNITESWFGMKDDDKSISMCHFSLGAPFAWFFEYLGGIRIEECSPGFSSIVLEPYCFESLGGCTVRYETPYGEIVSEWKFENGDATWNYKIPEGINAEIRSPHIIKNN